MAFVSPCSLLLLFAYGSILEKRGPRGALERTTLYCSSAILGASLAIEIAQRTNAVLWKTSIPIVKFISGPVFVFRESYVQLLTRYAKPWNFRRLNHLTIYIQELTISPLSLHQIHFFHLYPPCILLTM